MRKMTNAQDNAEQMEVTLEQLKKLNLETIIYKSLHQSSETIHSVSDLTSALRRIYIPRSHKKPHQQNNNQQLAFDLGQGQVILFQIDDDNNELSDIPPTNKRNVALFYDEVNKQIFYCNPAETGASQGLCQTIQESRKELKGIPIINASSIPANQNGQEQNSSLPLSEIIQQVKNQIYNKQHNQETNNLSTSTRSNSDPRPLLKKSRTFGYLPLSELTSEEKENYTKSSLGSFSGSKPNLIDKF